jgi:hypothetical protein
MLYAAREFQNMPLYDHDEPATVFGSIGWQIPLRTSTGALVLVNITSKAVRDAGYANNSEKFLALYRPTIQFLAGIQYENDHKLRDITIGTSELNGPSAPPLMSVAEPEGSLNPATIGNASRSELNVAADLTQPDA